MPDSAAMSRAGDDRIMARRQTARDLFGAAIGHRTIRIDKS